VEFKVIDKKSKYWNNILELGRKYDYEFVPAISQRMPLLEYFEQFKIDKAFTIIALDNDILIACFCGYIEKPENNESWFQYIIIEKEYRNKKIAQIFFEMGLDILKQNKKNKVKTRTWSTNLKSMKIIKDFGFLEIETILNDRSDGIHTINYEKSF